MNLPHLLSYSAFLAFLSCACVQEKNKTLFDIIPSSYSNIAFNNEITETDSLNVLTFEYIYNGAGVGVGDFNNDGLSDIFFSGNMVSSRLYLNRGNFKFEDVTLDAGVTTNLWCTGVSVIDINQDGKLDLYVSTVHPDENKNSPNLLFLNSGWTEKGIPKFTEIAHQSGLADSSYTTHAAFFDYDLDGDMDVYLLNNALENYNRNTPTGQRTDGLGKSVDKLYKCTGYQDGIPKYDDVSFAAGIKPEGWGLGVIINDFNRDGYPDIYAANDFLSNDHLFINNRDGTFTNEVARYLKHQEYNGMGIDAADINNDGLNDIVVMDMMPEDNLRQKTMFPNIGYDRFMLNIQKGYQPQYVRNVLQLNNGNNTFSDIGYLAGINATDWSWSALLADFDNDGYRDLLVTNGYRKDVTDLDFIAYSRESSMFGTDKTRMKKAIETIEELSGVYKPNVMFKNNGDLTFSDVTTAWGFSQPSYTNGAAYADFDNDGDLDVVMNNINNEAFLFRNNTKETMPDNNYLRFRLMGTIGNLQGLGAKIFVHANGELFFAEHVIHRGYKSTVDGVEHIGLGKISHVDSLVVRWPNGKSQTLKDFNTNQVIVLNEKDATTHHSKIIIEKTVFEETHTKHKVSHKAIGDEDFIDFKQGQALLPQKYSQLGPAVAVGDIDQNGNDDFIIGGARGKAAKIFFQDDSGFFRMDSLPTKIQEDMGIVLFDADNDDDLDVYCVSGSTEFGADKKFYQDRLYRNSGQGKFILDTEALPAISSSGSCAIAHDYDKDGDLDLFVGGRILPLQYPEPPESYLLQNDGKGTFKDVTPPDLRKPGLVTSAIWTDFDNDSWTDLILVGEWMPITFFKNKNGILEKFVPEQFNPAPTVGWWNSITAGDMDNDGDTDYIAGNVGLNSLYKASPKEPVSIFAKDFDNNGSIDPILCRYVQGKEYITHPRETLTEQIVSMRRPLTRYSIYGQSTFEQLFPSEKTIDALHYEATLFSSVYIENQGNGIFEWRALPIEAQVSPLFGIIATDFNLDGNLDILGIGNSYSTEPLTGYYDAGIGICLEGDGQGTFKSVNVMSSGFFVDGDAKALATIRLSTNKPAWIATANRDSTKILEHVGEFHGDLVNIGPDAVNAEITFTNGKKRKEEFNYGSSYLSQSSRTLVLPPREMLKSVYIFNMKGQRRSIALDTTLVAKP